jgi:thioredoxin reductase (NADPH)
MPKLEFDVRDRDGGVVAGATLTVSARFTGEGVLSIAGLTTDGRGRAGQGAMFFSRYARKVTMVIRGASLATAMSRYLVDRIEATPNIEVLLDTRVTGVTGEARLASVILHDDVTGEQMDHPTCGLFIFIGTAPRTRIVAEMLQLDPQGFILTGPDLMGDGKRPKGWMLDRDPYLFETSVPGIFAAGDARAGSGKRVASAVGEGSATVRLVHSYLSTV